MRLSELITIYLAAAAPVGVIYFMREQSNAARRSQALVRAACAALVWPLSALAFWLERRQRSASLGVESTQAARERAVEQTKRALHSALHAFEDLLAEIRAARVEESRQVLFAARESIERYAGLSLAVEAEDEDAAPSARELELCRIAGRRGDDLLLAGRCVRRGNVARLRAHHARSRTELLHALADVREFHARLRLPPDSGADAALRLSEAALRVYGRAIEMFSVLDDPGAAQSTARLLDAECARVRRLAVSGSTVMRADSSEGELCPTTPAPLTPIRERHTPLMPLPTQTTTAQG
ncbi:MAG TPA: hypothetical protein VNA19_15415 [Pyrinomonadaceae bacterium]|jgi:hypothetical protein|nr:hypothetical protein [Pyrinomonadaceae bacterium]